jgi:pyruvate carboxylase
MQTLITGRNFISNRVPQILKVSIPKRHLSSPLIFKEDKGYVDPNVTTPGSLPDFFKKNPDSLYVAGRGVAAQRIVETCNNLGIRVVVPVIDGDTERVRGADVYANMQGTGTEAFLNVAQHVDLANKYGCAAVHPGWGGWSEDSSAHRTVRDNGLWVIGPEPVVIDLMGSKTESAILASQAGLPIIKGTGIISELTNINTELANAGITFPVMVKAVSGGGGKGMRIARNAQELESSFKSAQNEARINFGDDRVFIQSLLDVDHARHRELQMIADRYGNSKCVGGRDCSSQRGNQKIIEESVDLFLAKESESLVSKVGYSNAGTLEFIYSNGKYSFLEMNTRLQVEHPVTEFQTGVDLVEAQLKVASGIQLSKIFPNELNRSSHTMNVRINAQEFKPLEQTMMPSAELKHGYTKWPLVHPQHSRLVTTYPKTFSGNFDSCVGLYTAMATTRNEAINILRKNLSKSYLPGTNLDFVLGILNSDSFKSDTHNLGTVSKLMQDQQFSDTYRRNEQLNSEVNIAKLVHLLADIAVNGTKMTGVINPELIQNKSTFPELPEVNAVPSQWPEGKTFGQLYSEAGGDFKGARSVIKERRRWVNEENRFLLGTERFRDQSQTRDANREAPREKQLAAPFYNQFPFAYNFVGGGADTHVVTMVHKEDPHEASAKLSQLMPDQISKALIRADAVVGYGDSLDLSLDQMRELHSDMYNIGEIKEQRHFHGLNDMNRILLSMKASCVYPFILDMCQAFHENYTADQSVAHFVSIFLNAVELENDASIIKKSFELGYFDSLEDAKKEFSIINRLHFSIKDAQGIIGLENVPVLEKIPSKLKESLKRLFELAVADKLTQQSFQDIISEDIMPIKKFPNIDTVAKQLKALVLNHFEINGVDYNLATPAQKETLFNELIPVMGVHSHNARGVHQMLANKLSKSGWGCFDVGGTEMMTTSNTQAPVSSIVPAIEDGRANYFNFTKLDDIAAFEYILNKWLSPLQGGNEQTANMAATYGIPPGMINNVRNAYLALGGDPNKFREILPLFGIVLKEILDATGVTPISKDAGDTALVLALEKVEATKEAIINWIEKNASKLPMGIKNIMLGRKGDAPFEFNQEVKNAVNNLCESEKPEFLKIIDVQYRQRCEEIDRVSVDVPAHLKRLDVYQFPGEIKRMLSFNKEHGNLYKYLPLDVKLRGLEPNKIYTYSFEPLERDFQLRLGPISSSDNFGMRNVEIEVDSKQHKVPIKDASIVVKEDSVTKLEPGQQLVRSNCVGVVFKLLKNPGDRVEKGDNIAILTAMKMEVTIASTASGILEKYLVDKCSSNTVIDGTKVQDGSELCIINETSDNLDLESK